MQRVSLILLIILIGLSSGCMNGGGGAAITVERLSVDPGDIREGQTSTVVLEVMNSGLEQGTVKTGENGSQIMTNYCPDYFKIIDFNARSTAPGDEMDNTTFSISKGDRLEMDWRLKHKEDAGVIYTGYDCGLSFEIPFNYSVSAFKQIQVVEEYGTETKARLEQANSPGPMAFDMKMIGSAADQKNTFKKGENVSILLTAYNARESEKTKDNKFIGLIKLGDVSIEASGVLEIEDKSCVDEGAAALYAGDEEIYRCNIDVDESSYQPPGARGEIKTSVNYTFVKQLREKTLTVEPDEK
jgi:hypothetical protein